MEKKPKILVTNDDGINSPGIYELVLALREIGDVIVVAPEQQQSAVSSAVTVSKPLRVKEFYRDGIFFGYAINGTPTDCVKLALNNLLDYKPDLLVSGINHGKNTAINVLYSGTVAGAIEGMLFGIKSIAVSVDDHSYDFECKTSAEYTAKAAKFTLENDIPNDTFLNINIPAIRSEEIKGFKITHLSQSKWHDVYEKRSDPFNRDYYWFAGEYTFPENGQETDDAELSNGWVTITPIKLEFTNYDFFSKLKNEFDAG
jgi:5'-nucleotidase